MPVTPSRPLSSSCYGTARIACAHLLFYILQYYHTNCKRAREKHSCPCTNRLLYSTFLQNTILSFDLSFPIFFFFSILPRFHKNISFTHREKVHFIDIFCKIVVFRNLEKMKKLKFLLLLRLHIGDVTARRNRRCLSPIPDVLSH